MISAQTRTDPRDLPEWRKRYFALWMALIGYGVLVFVGLNGPNEAWFEGAFFAMLFAMLLWPAYATNRSRV